MDVIGRIKWTGEKESVTISDDQLLNLKECILYDSSGHIPFTVWGDLIDELQENIMYSFTHLSLKYYFGQKLATTKKTTANPTTEKPLAILESSIIKEYEDKEKERKSKLSPKLCCPEVQSIEVDFGQDAIMKNVGNLSLLFQARNFWIANIATTQGGQIGLSASFNVNYNFEVTKH